MYELLQLKQRQTQSFSKIWPQIRHPNVRAGRTMPFHAHSAICGEIPQNFPIAELKALIVLLAAATFIVTWFLKASLGSRKTPKYFIVALNFTLVPDMVRWLGYLQPFGVLGDWGRFLVKIIDSVLLGEKVRP